MLLVHEFEYLKGNLETSVSNSPYQQQQFIATTFIDGATSPCETQQEHRQGRAGVCCSLVSYEPAAFPGLSLSEAQPGTDKDAITIHSPLDPV